MIIATLVSSLFRRLPGGRLARWADGEDACRTDWQDTGVTNREAGE